MMNRRRFLTLSAACAGFPAWASAVAPLRWSGIALGAEVSLELHGPKSQTGPALAAALRQIRRVETLFSLYDSASYLSRLNQTGTLLAPPSDMLALFDHTTQIHNVTNGLFDPTVQALWRAHADDTALMDAKIGWQKVRFDTRAIHLEPGQSLTFNGIAQGYATDLVRDILQLHGLENVLVNLGEHSAVGPSRRLALIDPTQGRVGTLTLDNTSLATSSPNATMIAGQPHIFSTQGTKPKWSTVSVMAQSATIADGLSTALCLADLAQIRAARTLPDVSRIVLVDAVGDVTTL